MTPGDPTHEALEYGPAPESPNRALEWIAARGGNFGHFIGGGWSAPDPTGSESFEVLNPASGRTLARVRQGSPEDVDRAVRAARAAQPEWWSMGAHSRSRHLYAIARRIQRNSRLFAVLESLDNGKPIRESRDIDIPLAARHFLHHAGWAQLLTDELEGYAPVGVCGQIIPWNFPLLMLSWKIAPALAAGNTVVLKPAEYTPLTALLFAHTCAEAGLPNGVVNIVTGDGETGAELVAHSSIDKIAFTGSTSVGRAIRRLTAGTGKRLTLELGGKSPFLVFDDADLDSVVEGVVDAIWFNQGQVCCAGSRILAHESIANKLGEKLRARMERLRMGDPLDKAVDMGAIIAPVQLERIEELVARGVEEGAEVWQPSWSTPKDGWFYPPTLCTRVAAADTLAQVEIFGPVVVLMTFRTHGEAVALANDTRYGLAASVWTENINLALDVAPRIKAGTVWVNCTNVFDAAAGFGGYRESGYGREGGLEGLMEYLRPAWEAEGASIGAVPTGGDGLAGVDELSGGNEPASGANPPNAAEAAHPPDPPDPEAAKSSTGAAPDRPTGAGPDRPLDSVRAAGAAVSVDRTHKLYIGGEQVRPDSGYSLAVPGADGVIIAEVGRGNRKDVRNAVEAARRAQPLWSGTTAHNRSQVLYFLAENLDARRDEFVTRLVEFSGDPADARREFAATIDRLFTCAAWADKWEGRVHHTPYRNVTLAMREPMGVIGISCPSERPLLALASCVAHPLAVGNAVVVLPSEHAPLPATDLYRVLEVSDVPAGVVNLITGRHAELLPTLADHDGVEAVWHFGDQGAMVEARSVGNLKRTWVSRGLRRDWFDSEQGSGPEFLHRATQVKNIWVPYGA